MQTFWFSWCCVCCYLLAMVANSVCPIPVISAISRPKTTDQLRADETIGTYTGALGPLQALTGHGVGGHTTYGLPAVGSYDDLHKYGGIGKKAHLLSLYNHGAKGYKNYYGDAAYGNKGLNKYTSLHKSDNYGGKSGHHANYHGGHVYSRNRGYGYEKHYMYDKEYSTSKHGGSKGGHKQYYGDHNLDSKSSLDAYKKYGHKNYGSKSDHAQHDYGKVDHLLDSHGDDYSKYPKIVEHTPYVSHHQYVPVQTDHYGGTLGHDTITVTNSGPLYADHGHDAPMLEYESHNLPSTAVYLPSASSSNSKVEPDVEMEVNKAAASASSPSPSSSSSSSPVRANSETALISTKLTSTSSTTPPLYATLGEAYPRAVNSAVHATPAIISTSTGTHYYSS